MNKKNIILIALFAVLMIPLGCKKDFLTQTNTFSSTVNGTFNKPQDVIALVNSVYDTYQNSDFLKKSMWYYANFYTHDWYNVGNDIVWNNYTVPATFGALSTFWNQSFIGIARANVAIAITARAQKKGVITQALADRLTGEAYFLRGIMFYYLGGTFGGVPLEVDTTQGVQNNGLRPRSTQTQTFTQVVADMQQAEKLLLSKTKLASGDLGRATSGAAYAYEGSAQMWLGQYSAALAVFNNPEFNNYSLIPNYLTVNEFNNQNNAESLFEIQFDVPAGGSQSWDGSWSPPGGEIAWIDSFSWPMEITTEGYDMGSPMLEYSYQTGDTRKLATIIGPGDANPSPGIIGQWTYTNASKVTIGGIAGYGPVQTGLSAYQASVDNHIQNASIPLDAADYNRYTDRSAPIGAGTNMLGAKNPGPIGPINVNGNIANPATGNTQAAPWYGTDGNPRSGFVSSKKWRDPSLTGGAGPQRLFGSQNQILMRYAEVILSRAECKIHLGDVAGAMADLALVRNRAFGGTAPTVWQDGVQIDNTPAPILNSTFPSAYTPGANAPTDPIFMVLSEYRHELTSDYSLMYMLRRAGKDANGKYYDQQFIHNNHHTYANTAADNNANPIIFPFGPTSDGATHGVIYNDIPVGHDILPIPQVAIGLNPNLVQNPTY